MAAQSESLAARAGDRAETISEVRAQLDDLTAQTSTLQEQLDAVVCDGTARSED